MQTSARTGKLNATCLRDCCCLKQTRRPVRYAMLREGSSSHVIILQPPTTFKRIDFSESLTSTPLPNQECLCMTLGVLTTSCDHLRSVERMNLRRCCQMVFISGLCEIFWHAHTMPHPWWWEVAWASHQSSHPANWAVSSRHVSISKELFKLMWLSPSPRLLWMLPSIGGDAESYKIFISTRSSCRKSRAGAGGLCPPSNPNFDTGLRDENAWVKQVRQDPCQWQWDTLWTVWTISWTQCGFQMKWSLRRSKAAYWGFCILLQEFWDLFAVSPILRHSQYEQGPCCSSSSSVPGQTLCHWWRGLWWIRGGIWCGSALKIGWFHFSWHQYVYDIRVHSLSHTLEQLCCRVFVLRFWQASFSNVSP